LLQEAPQCDDGDRLCVIPVLCQSPLLGRLLKKRTKRFSVRVHPQLALVPHDGPTHSTLDRAKEHGLHGTMKFEIFCALVGRLDICENSTSDNRTQWRRMLSLGEAGITF